MQTLAIITTDGKGNQGKAVTTPTTWRLAVNAGDMFDVIVEPAGPKGCGGLTWKYWNFWLD